MRLGGEGREGPSPSEVDQRTVGEKRWEYREKEQVRKLETGLIIISTVDDMGYCQNIPVRTMNTMRERATAKFLNRCFFRSAIGSYGGGRTQTTPCGKRDRRC